MTDNKPETGQTTAEIGIIMGLIAILCLAAVVYSAVAARDLYESSLRSSRETEWKQLSLSEGLY